MSCMFEIRETFDPLKKFLDFLVTTFAMDANFEGISLWFH